MEPANPNIPHRAAGVLLPMASLPSPYGIGSFGAAARRWIDFLHAAGQSYWQVLPLGPTGYGDSPYQSFSAFAGNPYFVDLDTLCEQGLLLPAEAAAPDWGADSTKVDYGAIYAQREKVLRRAYARFADNDALAAFCERHEHWLWDYALYMAIKATQGQRGWSDWAQELRHRSPSAMQRCRIALADDIRFHMFVQVQFYSQWVALRAYAAQRGVQIVGDIPIYVAMDSADVWANPGEFQLDAAGLPGEVAGCPPDAFSCDGQVWGNPLYNWAAQAQDSYHWWIRRMLASFELYDVLRIDHYRGLESYYAIPAAEHTAHNGRWLPGPGLAIIETLHRQVPNARIIAEDLGFLTDGVRGLLAASGYPGMKVLQFAFDSREESDYTPYRYVTNSVVYTGTHDNNTVLGWAGSAPPQDVAHAMAYTGVRRRSQLPEAFIRLGMGSASQLAMVPIQDWLGLPDTARINIPATLGGNNWRWRLSESALTPALAQHMRATTRLYGRQARQNAGPDKPPPVQATGI